MWFGEGDTTCNQDYYCLYLVKSALRILRPASVVFPLGIGHGVSNSSGDVHLNSAITSVRQVWALSTEGNGGPCKDLQPL